MGVTLPPASWPTSDNECRRERAAAATRSKAIHYRHRRPRGAGLGPQRAVTKCCERGAFVVLPTRRSGHSRLLAPQRQHASTPARADPAYIPPLPLPRHQECQRIPRAVTAARGQTAPKKNTHDCLTYATQRQADSFVREQSSEKPSRENSGQRESSVRATLRLFAELPCSLTPSLIIRREETSSFFCKTRLTKLITQIPNWSR